MNEIKVKETRLFLPSRKVFQVQVFHRLFYDLVEPIRETRVTKVFCYEHYIQSGKPVCSDVPVFMIFQQPISHGIEIQALLLSGDAAGQSFLCKAGWKPSLHPGSLLSEVVSRCRLRLRSWLPCRAVLNMNAELCALFCHVSYSFPFIERPFFFLCLVSTSLDRIRRQTVNSPIANNMASKDNERAILDRPLHGLSLVGAEKKTLLTYSTRSDKIMLFISFVCAILGGILNPLISVRNFVLTQLHNILIATDIADNGLGHLRSNCWCIPEGNLLVNSSTGLEDTTPARHLHTLLGLPIHCHLRSHLHRHSRILLHWRAQYPYPTQGVPKICHPTKYCLL